jgi:hypothetical protein
MVQGHPRATPVITGLVANLLLLVTLAYAAILWSFDGDFYYFSAQEDEYVEWATFWAFIAAGITYLRLLAGHRIGRRSIWFVLVLAAFCFVIAMEEISWGQRVFGYRPPDYFLKNNHQQEINLHNVLDTDTRKLGVYATVLGFGVVLPVVAFVPAIRRLIDRSGILVPTIMLAPGFAAAATFQLWYPIKFSGEWVEWMLGCGMLFIALWTLTPNQTLARRRERLMLRIVMAWFIVIGLGVATATATRSQHNNDPTNIEAAKTELQALRRDFIEGALDTRCGLHKRLYAYANQYDQDYLFEGEFVRLTGQGMGESRAEFLLDPWNSPYWLRDICHHKRSRRATLIYSFGPNRRRDSTAWKIKGDDIGIYLKNVKHKN